jgi:RNA polymerase sigma-70 factor, ECF subfamily
MKKYNLSMIMKRSHYYFKTGRYETFSNCLKQSWLVAKTNETPSYSEVFEKYYKTVCNWLNYKTFGKRNDIEDIAQEVFIKIGRYLHTYDSGKSGLQTFIITITNSVLLNHVAAERLKDNNLVEVDALPIVETRTADRMVLRSEKAKMISDAFKTLKGKELNVATLFFIQGYKYSEIVDELSLPLNSVKVYINRARIKLQDKLLQGNLAA